MQSKKRSTVTKPMVYSETPIQAIHGSTPVTHTNEHGFNVTTLHFYLHDAERERVRLAKLGYQVQPCTS